MNFLPLGYSLDLAIVRNVGQTFVECQYIGSSSEQSFSCPKPHPYAGRGAGIFVGIEKDVLVLIAKSPGADPFIVGTVPDRNLYFNQEGIKNSPIYISEYPNLESGEICLRGLVGSRFDITKKGNIKLDAGIGSDAADFELSKPSETLFIRTNNVCQFTEAGRNIEGLIKRDIKNEEDPEDTKTLDFLTSEIYDEILNNIGRTPNRDPQLRTTKIIKDVIRNPPLIEKRSLVYEYANGFGVRGLTHESQSMVQVGKDINKSIDNIQINNASRENRRTDILDLNLRNYNHLIEKTEGTVADIYGNILDLNRNIIDIPDLSEINTDNSSLASHGLRRLYSHLRRSIKYHFEINSRKDIGDADEPSVTDDHKKHSRFSIDVDGEGLTKINIPCSSETGNIPILSRYIVSRDDNSPEDGSYKDNKEDNGVKRDIRVIPFGASNSSSILGQQITDSKYIPIVHPKIKKTLAAGTAHHDILSIAPSILCEKDGKKGGKLRDPEAKGGSVVLAVSGAINNVISQLKNGQFDANPDANAGGRSVHANLDGSMEMSIGADTVDRKSLVLDLAGGAITHYGRDKNGRSIISQTDGDVIIQVGGTGIEDKRFSGKDETGRDKSTEDRPGRVEIHLNRPGGTSQKIIIDEKGMTLDITGNITFKSSGDFAISAAGNLLLNGENVWMHGAVESDIDKDRKITGKESLMARDGRKK